MKSSKVGFDVFMLCTTFYLLARIQGWRSGGFSTIHTTDW